MLDSLPPADNYAPPFGAHPSVTVSARIETALKQSASASNYANMERAQIEDIVATASAKADTKLATAMGEMKTEFSALRGEISKIEASMVSKSTFFLGGLSLFLGLGALILAALSYGNGQFGQGLSASDVANKAADQAVTRALAIKH